MLLRSAVGFTLLVGFLALGAMVARQRSTGRMPWRRLAGGVDRGIGFVAVAFLVLLALTMLRLML